MDKQIRDTFAIVPLNVLWECVESGSFKLQKYVQNAGA